MSVAALRPSAALPRVWVYREPIDYGAVSVGSSVVLWLRQSVASLADRGRGVSARWASLVLYSEGFDCPTSTESIQYS